LINEAIEANSKTKNYLNLSYCYQTQSDLFSLQNKHIEAKEAIVNYASLRDSIYNEEAKESIKNLEDQRTIDLKNKEIQINKITLENKEKQKWVFVYALLFFAIMGGLLFHQNNKRKKTNEMLQSLNVDLDTANKTKVRFLSILNHDLRSPVYNFIHFMQLQKESPELLDAETKKSIEAKTIASAENLLCSMEDLLLWSKGQMDNFEPVPSTIAISELFLDTQKHFESEENVQLLFQNPENTIVETDGNFLKTIIRNLTGNAIKALKETNNAIVTWKAWQENNKTYLAISDNGSGANQEKFKALYDENQIVGIKTGLGLHLIRDLAKAINCKITVNSSSAGTTFTLQL
jgi:signal transduction histidine kinase